MAGNEPRSDPVTPDEFAMSSPASPGSADESSEASTPLDHPSAGSDASPSFSPSYTDPPRRVPSLRTVSDPQSGTLMSSSSSVAGILNNARRPPPSANSLPLDIMQRARALQEQRLNMGGRGGGSMNLGNPMIAGAPMNMGASMNMGGRGGGSMNLGNPMIAGAPMNMGASMNMGGPIGGQMAGQMSGGLPGGVPPGLKLPGVLARPLPPGFPKSAPTVPRRKPPMSLSERRAMKMGGLPPGSPSPAGTPKLSDMDSSDGGDGNSAPKRPSLNGEKHSSKLNDFKNYIDADKGWITFDGAATITRTGVNFADGKTFSISLDEVEVLDELGKGNYGTVYKVRHARSKAPRFGQGLSNYRIPSRNSSMTEDDASTDDGSTISAGGTEGRSTTGVTMAMKEIRLELDEAKFTTILKELVILHECVSPYIIDFYGAFYQEGAVYMCIEYMDGGSIDKLYAGGIPENVLRKMTFATILGLKTLKDDHNIIHRDVKPTNILVNTNGQVKICDFGVSGNLVASIAKTNIGCQSYMAPERISGGALAGAADGSYNVQSDIWSLGLTIIECAMGRYPYPPEISSTIFSQLSAIVEGDPPDLPSEGYSAAAKDFVRCCLNKIPTKRHTYPMLLMHPWIKSLGKPETITEEAEAEDAAAEDNLADITGGLSISTPSGHVGEGDYEVAEWVKGVLDRKRRGLLKDLANKPALHAAPLDRLSPVGSPMVGA